MFKIECENFVNEQDVAAVIAYSSSMNFVASPNVINLAENKKINSVIYLKSGIIILSPYKPSTIMSRLQQGVDEK